ncbi:amidohydrolase [Microbaculum marinisediminis]|uniref:Amidohydrolase n=1 Tax=Microbaculum marinisediminis TaxID=2931392 RepID=A0AAW5QYL0_9HYPH|nr:amidohydrolase [Microbaculum sp. A6E488]MCT8971999.1 amidohydrolase [Microbaculum sp. A6E488]
MSPRADIIVTNARVLTVDSGQPRAEAIAIVDNEIMAVGSAGDIDGLKSHTTRVIDAGGASVLPGFNDAHVHLFCGAAELDNLQLGTVNGLDELTAAARAYAAERPDEPLLVAQGAGYGILPDNQRITRQHLDAILPDRAFLMFAADHHTAWANTKALADAGILNGKAVGVGNEIVMGADGKAAGELREGEAYNPVLALGAAGMRFRLGLETGGEPDPAPTAAERAFDLDLMRKGLAHCAAHGITSVQNMDGNLYQLELLDAIDREEGLSLRVRVPFHFRNFMETDVLDKAEEMHRRFRSERLRSGFVKMFMDGVVDSWTAVMLDDYPGKPGWRGDPLFEPARFAEIATEADRRGLQIAVHAIGDGAVRGVLDGYEAARKANGPRDSRHRIEHIEVIHPDDLGRFRDLGVAASMQPIHAPGTGFSLQPTASIIGEAKWPYAYAWQTVREAGAPMIFATDWPVSPIDPMSNLKAALTRKRWAESDPDQRQSLSDALASYTRDGAWIEFMENRKGMLRPGMLADVVVLSDDIETTDPEAIDQVRPAVTIADGRVVYEA